MGANQLEAQNARARFFLKVGSRLFYNALFLLWMVFKTLSPVASEPCHCA